MAAGEAVGQRTSARAPHLALLCVLALVAFALAAQPPPVGGPGRSADLGATPFTFVANAGQTDAAVRYMARGANNAFYFTSDKAVLDFQRGQRGVALELRFRGANPSPQIVAEQPTGARVSHLTGAQPQRSLAAYEQVRYRALWPGIDMVFRGHGGALKYEFHVAPGANPRDIRLAYAGADSLRLAANGGLAIATPLGTLRDAPPKSVQGARAVDSRYVVSGASYGFALGAYDRSRALVIDPGLSWSTLLGGSDFEQFPAVALDQAGNVYVAGQTGSSDFPTTPGAVQYGDAGGTFVTKLNSNGAIVYSARIAGGVARNIAVDAQGSAYIHGQVTSDQWPTTPGAYDTVPPEEFGAKTFVTKLSPAGDALDYSTFYGRGDTASGPIAVDSQGNAYVAGGTFDPSFPTTPSAFDTTPSSTGGRNGYVGKFDATGSTLLYSTLLNGVSQAIAVDSGGHAHVTGSGDSTLQTTPGAFDTSLNGGTDTHITKLSPDGSALIYGTYLGGNGFDRGIGIALDSSGNAYVTGTTQSSNFPTTPGAYRATQAGSAFAAKLDPAGSALSYSTYLDVAPFESRFGGIALDSGRSAYIAGVTTSATLQATADAFDPSFNGGDSDAYVVRLTPTGSTASYATYLGGDQRDWASGIAVLGPDRVYAVGYTSSPNYPTTPGAHDSTLAGCCDAFITKLDTTSFSGYARPKGATPARFSLAIAYEPCTDPNELHGPPLAYGSCAGPEMTSDFLTVGTADANARPALNEGYVRLDTMAGNPATLTDEADLKIEMFADDVFTKALVDYIGELRAALSVRITDRDNSTGGGPAEAGTTTEFPIGATFPCGAIADPQEGASCAASTTVDAVVPGAIAEGKRAIWQIERVRVFDGGPDGDGDTPAGDTLFATQGVFVP